MNALRAYLSRYSLTLLNAALIGVVYVGGIAARPQASAIATARLRDWFGITDEMTIVLLLLSVVAMASPWYVAKYAALIIPGVYAGVVFGYVWGNAGQSWVYGLMPVAMVMMMAWGVRMEQGNVQDG